MPSLVFPCRGIVVLATATLLAACNSPSPRSEPLASASSALTIAGLFDTGVDGAGVLLPVGSTDPHYVLTSTDPAFPGPNAIVVTPAGGWTPSTLTSEWLSPQANTVGAPNATYSYTTTFTLNGVDPATATLSGNWACDDSCALSLNGTVVATRPAPAYGSLASFTVPAGSPFVLGTNTLVFVTVNSGGGPTGVQVNNLTGTVAGCTADNQCASTQFCNTQSASCTSKLANGQPIPTVSAHNPTLNGMCTSAAGSSVCSSAVCDPSNNQCGFANGDGPCTNGSVCQSAVCDSDGKCGFAVGDGPCTPGASSVCRSGACSQNGLCEPTGGCNVDADCAGGDWCNETTHTCNPKLGNGTGIPTDVAHSNPTLNGMCTVAAAILVCQSGVCDTSNNECGFAPGDGPCTTTVQCQAGVCALGMCSLTGCTTDTDCPPGNWCNETAQMCSPRLANGTAIPTDGAHMNPTLNGTCTTQSGALVCQSGVCDTADNKCGFANGDGTCTPASTAVCRSGVCAVTGPNATKCVACVMDSDCPSTAPHCDTVTTNTCEGCLIDSDCGGTTSGMVCSGTSHSCVNGCRGMGGNGCPTGDTCTSSDNTIGQCVVDTTTSSSTSSASSSSSSASSTSSSASSSATSSSSTSASSSSTSSTSSSTTSTGASTSTAGSSSASSGGGVGGGGTGGGSNNAFAQGHGVFGCSLSSNDGGGESGIGMFAAAAAVFLAKRRRSSR